MHRLSNGTRVLDALGPDDADISFSGVFSGQAATDRARTLDLLRQEGRSVSLEWDNFYYTVIVTRFIANYNNPVWIPYFANCAIIDDGSEQTRAGSADDDLIQAILLTGEVLLQQVPITSAVSLSLSSSNEPATSQLTARAPTTSLAAIRSDVNSAFDIASTECVALTTSEPGISSVDIPTFFIRAEATSLAMTQLLLARCYLDASMLRA
jgi:hypothetical protein